MKKSNRELNGQSKEKGRRRSRQTYHRVWGKATTRPWGGGEKTLLTDYEKKEGRNHHVGRGQRLLEKRELLSRTAKAKKQTIE